VGDIEEDAAAVAAAAVDGEAGISADPYPES
jgi:hypothetical protein